MLPTFQFYLARSFHFKKNAAPEGGSPHSWLFCPALPLPGVTQPGNPLAMWQQGRELVTWLCEYVPSFQLAYSCCPKAHLPDMANSAWIIKLFLYSIVQASFREEVTRKLFLGYTKPAKIGVDGWKCGRWKGRYYLSLPDPQVFKVLALQALN